MSIGSKGCSISFEEILGRVVRDPYKKDRRMVDGSYWVLLRDVSNEGYIRYVIKDVDGIFVNEVPEDSIFDDEVILNPVTN